jgi:hypothetical protein
VGVPIKSSSNNAVTIIALFVIVVIAAGLGFPVVAFAIVFVTSIGVVVSTFLQAVTTVCSSPATFVKFIVVSGVAPINLYNALYLTDVAVVPVPLRITVYDAGVGIAVSSPYIVTNKKSFCCKFKDVKLIDVTLLPPTAPKN